MLIDIKSEVFNVDAVVGEKAVQTMVNGDLKLPAHMPDIEKVLSIGHDIKIQETKIYDGKVTFEGEIVFKVLYAADVKHYMQPVFYTEMGLDFTANADVQGANSKMAVHYETKVEDLDYTVVPNEKGRQRVINVKSLLELYCKVTDKVQTEIVTHMEGINDLQLLKKEVLLDKVIGHEVSICNIKDRVVLPEGKPYIDDIVKVGGKIVDIDSHIDGEEIQVDGALEVSIIYESALEEESPVHYITKKIPFAHSIEVAELSEGDNYFLDFNVTQIHWDVKKDDHDCPTIVDLEFNLEVKAKVTRVQNRNVILDAYSPTVNIVVETKLLKLKEFIGLGKKVLEISEAHGIPQHCPPIIDICDVQSNLENIKCRVIDGKVIVNGEILLDILYIAEHTKIYLYPIYDYKFKVPFNTFIEVEGATDGMECDVKVRLDSLAIKVTGKSSLEIRSVLEINGKVLNKVQLDCIVSADVQHIEAPVPIECPSMIIYIVQPGDSLWKIAKKYNTTIEEIVKLNKIENPDLIYPGQQLIICPVGIEIELPLC